MGRGPAVSTLVFGFPGVSVPQSELPPTPYHLPLLVLEDGIVLANDFATP